MRRLLAVLALGCLVAAGGTQSSAHAGRAPVATAPTAPVYDSAGRLVDTPYAPIAQARLTEKQAVALVLLVPAVARWLRRYPPHPITDATFDRQTLRWTAHVWSGRAGEIVRAVVVDSTRQVVDVWTGPQVAWQMARGGRDTFGGPILDKPIVWYSICAAFLLGLADLRRPLSLRNLDLIALLGFCASFELYVRGHVFASVTAVYPPLLYLLARCAWIGLRGRRDPTPRSSAPVWLLAALAVFLLGFRIGLNVQASHGVIDVGYAGVIGAERIVHGQAPYGHMPVEANRPACGPADASGEIRSRIQTNGRCEAANPSGDTYGPVAYLAYVPAVLAFPWTGAWDALPAAHAASIGWDLLAALGLVLVGLRLGDVRLAATLVFAWTAYPFTAYALMADTNDAIAPALLVWGFLLLHRPAARGVAVALSGWTKFVSLVVAPLWLTYPRFEARSTLRFAAGFVAATAAAFSILLLEPSLWHAARTFWDRTIPTQVGRQSPFSPWDWGQYHAAGTPDLHIAQRVLEVAVAVLALVLAFVPRRKGPLELAALTAALLLASELVLTHWFYFYLVWVLPFVALTLFLPSKRACAEPV
jgi:hypothetical protein